MQQIKIFVGRSTNVRKLEDEVNKWLADNPKILVLQITSLLDQKDYDNFLVTVLYKTS
jgi:hypothetical protein